MEVLKIDGLTKQFGGLTAVSNVTFSIPQGKIYGLIGPNGAGKTTVYNLITGIYQPTKGTIELEGNSVVGHSCHEIVQKGVARTFQNLRLFRKLTALDNIIIARQYETNYSLWDAAFRTNKFKESEEHLKKSSRDLLQLVGLEKYIYTTAENLPYGHQRRLEIARALALNPKLLLLDEPAAGMNPDESITLMDFIQDILHKFDVTILLIEHHMEVVMGICDHIIVLNFGKEIAQGSPEEVQNNREVISAYLGEVDENAIDY
ncbi:MAG: ABC transporter ATP-binding protein [Chloroflexi bacterium]|nr:ABC transporter ATP-binding protein [Chloroflexota bacterium]